MNKHSCISLFSGGGGLDLGLEAAGFETLVATDIDEHSCISLANNRIRSIKKGKPFLRKANIIKADVTFLSGNKLLESASLRKGELNLLAGGPPCQAFSVFGKRCGRNDPRGMLGDHYLRLLKEIDPEAFVFENVYGLMTISGGKVFDDLREQLSKPGKNQTYEISVHRLNAVDYGVPQFRDRVFIIGSKSGARVNAVKQICTTNPDLPDNLRKARTVGNALGSLPPIGTTGIDNHIGRKHSQRIIDRYASMSPGERDKCTRINKLDLTKPSYTIIVGSDAGGGKGHIHPIDPREVTPRESARIQTFPDWWGFSGTSRHPIRQVGNAVPSLLGVAVGNAISTEIFGNKSVDLDEALELLDQNHLFSSAPLSTPLTMNSPGDQRQSRLQPKTEAIPCPA